MHSSCVVVAHRLEKAKKLSDKLPPLPPQPANEVEVCQLAHDLRERQKARQLPQARPRLLAVRTAKVARAVEIAPDRRHDVLLRKAEELCVLKVVQKVAVAELHVRQPSQHQPSLPKAQCQLVLPEHWQKRVAVAPHMRRHQFELRDRLCQARRRLLVLK